MPVLRVRVLKSLKSLKSLKTHRVPGERSLAQAAQRARRAERRRRREPVTRGVQALQFRSDVRERPAARPERACATPGHGEAGERGQTRRAAQRQNTDVIERVRDVSRVVVFNNLPPRCRRSDELFFGMHTRRFFRAFRQPRVPVEHQRLERGRERAQPREARRREARVRDVQLDEPRAVPQRLEGVRRREGVAVQAQLLQPARARGVLKAVEARQSAPRQVQTGQRAR